MGTVKDIVSNPIESVGKGISGVGKAAKTVGKGTLDVATLGLTNKTIKDKLWNPYYSAMAPILTGGMFQPEQLGIHNAGNQSLYDKFQLGTRAVGGAALGLAGGAGGAFGSMGVPGAGGTGSGFLGSMFGSGAGGGGGGMLGMGNLFGGGGFHPLNWLAGGGPLSGLMGGGGAGGGGGGLFGGGGGINPLALLGGYLGYAGSRDATNSANEMMGKSTALLDQAATSGMVSPAAQKSARSRALETLRGAQAARGVFNSGPAIQQEMDIMPLVDQQMNQMAFQNQLALAGAYNPMVGSLMSNAGSFSNPFMYT